MPLAMQQISLQTLFYFLHTAELLISDFQLCNSKVLGIHKVLADSFCIIYPINNESRLHTVLLLLLTGTPKTHIAVATHATCARLPQQS
jgi:hypothetical protein